MMSDGQVWDAAWTAEDASYDYLNPESLALNRGGTSLTNSNLKAWYPMQDGHRGDQAYILDASNTGLGDELVTNGDFATAGSPSTSSWSLGWSLGSVNDEGSEITGGELVLTDPSSDNFDSRIYATNGSNALLALTVGAVYKLTYTISEISETPILRYYDGSGYVAAPSSAVGTHSVYYTQGAATSFILINDTSPDSAASVVKLSNVSLKKINDKNNATTVFYGDNLLLSGSAEDVDFEDSGNTVTLTQAYLGGGGSGANYDPDNTSSPLTGSKDAKFTVSTAGEGCGLTSPGVALVQGRTYKYSFNYKVNQNIAKFKIASSGGTDIGGGNITNSEGYGQGELSQTSKTEHTQTFTMGDATGTYYLVWWFSDTTSTNVLQIDDISIKEVGVATGWTDADQQLHIPQTTLQSYNELAWFDGVADYVEIADHNDFTFIDGSNEDLPFSVSAWIFMNDAASFPIVCKDEASKREWFFGTASNSKLNFMLLDQSASVATEHGSYDTALLAGQWYHVVGTYNGVGGASASAGLKIYIDGNEVAVAVADTGTYVDMENLGGKVMIGARTGPATDAYANGVITETSIWADELSQAEVSELYNDGKALDALTHSAAANIKGYWRNNGLSTWTDLKNSHDGTPTSVTETLLIPPGVDGSRDSQGFLMNRQRNTSSLNLTTNTIADGIGDGERVTVPGRIDLGTDDFSISFWAYKFQDWAEQWVISQYENTNNRWYIKANSASPRLLIYAKSASNVVLHHQDTTDLDGASYMENWTHIVAVVDRDSYIKWYINGALTTTGTVDGSGTEDASQEGVSLTMDADVNVGWNEDPAFDDHHFNGKIDGVLIYNDALSAAEVLRNYNATKGSHRN
jgi:hypothetical protein